MSAGKRKQAELFFGWFPERLDPGSGKDQVPSISGIW